MKLVPNKNQAEPSIDKLFILPTRFPISEHSSDSFRRPQADFMRQGRAHWPLIDQDILLAVDG